MAALVELLGEAGTALVLLGGLLGFMFASGGLQVWGATFGRMLLWMADHMNFSIHRFGVTVGHDFGNIFRDANQSVVAWLQHVRAGSEVEIAWSIRTMRLIWQAQAEAIDWLASETAETFDKLIHGHLPKWARYVIPETLLASLVLKYVKGEIAKLRPEVVKTVKVVEHAVPQTVTKIVHAVREGAIELPGWVIHIPREIHNIVDQAGRLEHRLRKVETIFGATAFAAALANVWGIPFRCARSGGPMGRLARSLCGLSGQALNDLLGLVVDVLIVEDVCQVIVLLEDALSLVQGPLNGFVDVVDGALCHGDYDAPPVVNVPALSLPPVTGLALSKP